jgi:hypothetical protein
MNNNMAERRENETAAERTIIDTKIKHTKNRKGKQQKKASSAE